MKFILNYPSFQGSVVVIRSPYELSEYIHRNNIKYVTFTVVYQMYSEEAPSLVRQLKICFLVVVQESLCSMCPWLHDETCFHILYIVWITGVYFQVAHHHNLKWNKDSLEFRSDISWCFLTDVEIWPLTFWQWKRFWTKNMTFFILSKVMTLDDLSALYVFDDSKITHKKWMSILGSLTHTEYFKPLWIDGSLRSKWPHDSNFFLWQKCSFGNIEYISIPEFLCVSIHSEYCHFHELECNPDPQFLLHWILEDWTCNLPSVV